MSSDRGPSLPSQTGLAPGSVSTGPASALMSSVMDGLVTAAHIQITTHGQCRVILVRGCVTGPVSPVPPFLGVTQSSESPPGDFSRPRPRITMTRRGESEDGHVTNIGHPVSYCQ